MADPKDTPVIDDPTIDAPFDDKDPTKAVAPVDTPSAGTLTDLPPEYQGKSPEELVKIIANKDSMIGRQSQEVADARRELAEIRDSNRRPPATVPFDDPIPGPTHQNVPAPVPAPNVPVPAQNFDYSNPVESIQRLVADGVMQYAQYQNTQTRAQNQARANAAFFEGRRVVEANKELFAGIERDVEQALISNFKPQLDQGLDISPYIRNPQIWIRAAQNIRLDREEFDKITPKAPAPMMPTPHDTPAAVGGIRTPGGTAEVVIDWNDPEVVQLMKDGSYSKEDIINIVKTEQAYSAKHGRLT